MWTLPVTWSRNTPNESICAGGVVFILSYIYIRRPTLRNASRMPRAGQCTAAPLAQPRAPPPAEPSRNRRRFLSLSISIICSANPLFGRAVSRFPFTSSHADASDIPSRSIR